MIPQKFLKMGSSPSYGHMVQVCVLSQWFHGQTALYMYPHEFGIPHTCTRPTYYRVGLPIALLPID
jgi:hypothetical protein